MAINGREYGSKGPSTAPVETKSDSSSSSHALNLGKVFGIMFIWLLVTAGIAIGLGYLFNDWLNQPGQLENAFNTIFIVLIGSAIVLIINTLIIQFFALKKGKGMIVLSSISVIATGVLCSSVTLYIDWYILGVALGITTAIFGVLALIGIIARNVKPIAMIAMMIFIGAGITALVTWIVILVGGARISGNARMWLWIIDFAIFGAMLLMVIVDMYHINKICEKGEVSTNLTLYCALTLYSDFIYIFLKIAYYIAIATGNNK